MRDDHEAGYSKILHHHFATFARACPAGIRALRAGSHGHVLITLGRAGVAHIGADPAHVLYEHAVPRHHAARDHTNVRAIAAHLHAPGKHLHVGVHEALARAHLARLAAAHARLDTTLVFFLL